MSVAGVLNKEVQDEEPRRNVEEREAYHDEPHDRPGAEGYAQAFVERVVCGPRGAIGGIGGGLHSEESRESREEASGDERERHPVVLHFQAVGEKGEKNGDDHKHGGHHLVLLAQVRERPAADVPRDFAHRFDALFLLFHSGVEMPRERERDY